MVKNEKITNSLTKTKSKKINQNENHRHTVSLVR